MQLYFGLVHDLMFSKFYVRTELLMLLPVFILEKLYRHFIILISIFNNTCTYFIVINFSFNTKESLISKVFILM